MRRTVRVSSPPQSCGASCGTRSCGSLSWSGCKWRACTPPPGLSPSWIAAAAPKPHLLLLAIRGELRKEGLGPLPVVLVADVEEAVRVLGRDPQEQRLAVVNDGLEASRVGLLHLSKGAQDGCWVTASSRTFTKPQRYTLRWCHRSSLVPHGPLCIFGLKIHQST